MAYSVDEKIDYFREWTLGADEKTFQAKDTDFVDEGGEEEGIVEGHPILLDTTKYRVVHPPAADVGATILCESEELMAPWSQEKVWGIQSGIPIVFEALEIDLPAGRSYSDSWHRYAPVKPVEVAPNHWRWEIKEMPKLDLRDVKARPEWEALVARMSVDWGDAAVPGKDNQWRALGQWTTTLEANRPDPTPEITAKAEELVAGAPDFYTKLKDITEYIQKNIRYFIVVRGIGGMQAHPAGDIFRNRYGDCKDKTTLLISMLQSVGIHAYYVPVDHRRGVVDPDAPSIYGDHMITAIEVPAEVSDPRLMAVVKANDGKRYLIFDPTDERTPVGNLPSNEQGGYGILAAGPASQILALPVLPPDSSGTEQKGTFTLSADGALTGTVDTVHNGPEGGDVPALPEVHRRERAPRGMGKAHRTRFAGRGSGLVSVCTTALAGQAARVPLQGDGGAIRAHHRTAPADAAARGRRRCHSLRRQAAHAAHRPRSHGRVARYLRHYIARRLRGG